MTTAKILVAGATGNVGSKLVDHLVRSGRAARLLARDPHKATRLLGPRVEVIHGDLASLTPAFLRSGRQAKETAHVQTE